MMLPMVTHRAYLDNEMDGKALSPIVLGLFGDISFGSTLVRVLIAKVAKGTSKSPLMFELVLRLRKLEMKYNILLHVAHVAGKRMINQGTDGLSRADHSTGAITGRDIRHWFPLNKGALESLPSLKGWLGVATKGMGFRTLTPEGWFTTGHFYGTCIWAPPPSAGGSG
jgi:hypothetical protein